LVLTGLIANMKYDWKVKTLCCSSAGTYSESDFTNTQIFTTLPVVQQTCNVPAGLNATNISQTGVTLSWSHSVNSCTYLIYCYPANSTNTNAVKYVKTQDTVVNISGLTPNTNYVWKIKTYCCNQNGGFYGESSFQRFTDFQNITGTGY